MLKLLKIFKYGHEDITFKVFKDWTSSNYAHCWINARITLKKVTNASTHIHIIYSSLVIKNAVHFTELKTVESRGYHLGIVYNDACYQNLSFSVEKNPDYAEHDFLRIDQEEILTKKYNESDFRKFNFVNHASFKRLISHERMDAAINTTSITMKTILAECLGKTKVRGIFDSIERWVWSFDWFSNYNADKIEYKFFQNSEGEYAWLKVKYGPIKSSFLCCDRLIDKSSANELEIIIDCYHCNPCRMEHFEEMRRISNTLNEIKQHSVYRHAVIAAQELPTIVVTQNDDLKLFSLFFETYSLF